MNYSELTRRYFESAAAAGELHGPDVFRGAAGDRERGTWVQFDLQVGQGKVRAARFLAFACPHSIAVCAWLTETALGKPLQRNLADSAQELRRRFEVPVEKMGRLLIIEDAWAAAAAAGIASRV